MSEHKQDAKRSYSAKLSKSIGHNEDVEFSEELADQEDWEALERSERADRRQQQRR
ncbi:YfhD family protein [Paenibacillus bouchesdurhonensis]|uniref:YfhD family protein n=1 Tax=Paenibacillus bouchesdurhonensis TaxID=1870990 RepID=UPI000DA63A61|nr:YfhD family protein [Paenibacillus bouchesdurhonensis]